MKEIPTQKVSMRFFTSFIFVTLAFSLISCSSFSNRKTAFNDDEGAPTSQFQTVPKVQYDQLLSKYNELIKSSQLEQEKSNSSTADRKGEELPSLVKKDDLGDIVDDLNKAKIPQKNELVETVDVFDKIPSSNNSKVAIDASQSSQKEDLDGASIENQILNLRKADSLIRQNQFNAALGILKGLENSPVKQIKVWAKFSMGEMLFTQKEYDLAMQLFEEVVTQHAFSGVVLKALGRLIICSEKLKLAKKQDQYYSLLHDFFENS